MPSKSKSSASSAAAASASAPPSSPNAAVAQLQDTALRVWQSYLDKTPQRTMLLDAFMAFLVVVGAVQFVYCVLAGNFPFNAFLAGFSATVGQFVLTASLRIQTNVENEESFKGMSQERAFADFVLGSLILHFFCVNFIN